MQFTPDQIKEKLLKALDDDNNVKNSQEALHVVQILENYPITTQILESTRLGRIVNEMRKKTDCVTLAKRAKNLVRQWQVLSTSQRNNGQIAHAPGVVNGARVASPLNATPRGSPLNATPRGSPRPLTPGNNNLSPRLTRPPLVRPRTPSNLTLTPPPPVVRGGTTTSDTAVSKTNAANKRRRREEDNDVTPAKKPSLEASQHNTMQSNQQRVARPTPEPAARLRKPHAAKHVSSPRMTSNTPKVKTTAELIADMKARGSFNTDTEEVSRIERDLVLKESADEPSVTQSAKPRPYRKRKAPQPGDDPTCHLTDAKNEIVQKFLQSSMPPPGGATASKGGRVVSPLSQDQHGQSRQDAHISSPCDSSGQTSTCSQPDNAATNVTLDEIYARLPALDLDAITWSDDEEEETDLEPRAAVGADSPKVDRLHNESWIGVNGQVDRDSAWRSWTQPYTVTSYNDVPLHLLPYVDIDDNN